MYTWRTSQSSFGEEEKNDYYEMYEGYLDLFCTG